MKRILLFFYLCLGISCFVSAQVTQLNANKSLHILSPLANNKAILISETDSTLWVTDATTAGTFQLSNSLFYKDAAGIVNNKLIFAAENAATGSELWITDGTIAGTALLKDIYPGATSSAPDDDFALLNSYLYFTAVSPGIGRELWRTNGTTAGTTLVKDIIAGPVHSALKGEYDIFSTGNYLLLTIPTTTEGAELWKSDGTDAGTQLLKDINPGFASSDAGSYQLYNNLVLFTANNGVNGSELWKTDGTTAGTTLVKDIRPGMLGGVNFLFLYPFNGKVYFTADNGATGDEIWSTDGTPSGTALLKDIATGITPSFASLFNAMKVGSKFFFSAYTNSNGFELWESDGTTAGTKLFREMIAGMESTMPFILPSFGFTGTTYTQPLFGGTMFFFLVSHEDIGVELWRCDGTLPGTVKVKTINATDETISNLSYSYTTSALYFAADGGTFGNELWKSNGTEAGTQQVADVNPGTGSSDIQFSFVTLNNKLLFSATNGNHATFTDLYRLDADVISLPIQLGDFTVHKQADNALLNWYTLSEENSKNFIIERSFDGTRFTTISTVAAAGNSNSKQSYSFTDPTIASRNEEVIYYRLVLQDLDGKKTISPVKTLKLKGSWAIQITGNPVTNTIRLAATGNNRPLYISVKDILGRTLKSATVATAASALSIPINELPAGTYFLVAQCGAEVTSAKFVKQ